MHQGTDFSEFLPSNDKKYRPLPPIPVSEHLEDLLERLLQRVPAQRISYEHFFRHPWLSQQVVNMKYVVNME